MLSASTCCRLLSRRFASAAVAAENIQRNLPTDYDPSTFDPNTARPPPSDRVWRLVDDVAGLTLREIAELSCILREKMEIKEMPIVGIFNAGGVGGGAAMAGGSTASAKDDPKKESKTVFELKLDSFDAASKIKVIKEVRAFTNLGLKEAKELVEKAPTVIKGGLSKEEATQIIEKMKAVGAKVIME